MGSQDLTVRLVVRIDTLVDITDSAGFPPIMGFVKTSRISEAQAHEIARICNGVENYRVTRVSNERHVVWVISVIDTTDIESILSQFGLEEYNQLPHVGEADLTISLTRL